MNTNNHILKDNQYYKFCLYGFLKNLRFFEPFFILFFISKELSFLEIATIYAIREVAINLFEIPSGIIADVLGRRKTLASSFLIYIFAFIIFYLSSNYYLFTVAMLFYALGDAIRSGINKAMIVDYLKRTNQSNLKVEYYGHTRSWSQFGSAISSLAGGVLVFYNHNLEVIFLFSIIPYLIDFVNVLSYPKYLDETTETHLSTLENVKQITSTFFNALKDRELLKTLINFSIYSGYYKSVKDFIQPFLQTLLLTLPVLMFLTNEEKLALTLGVVYFLIFLVNSYVSRNASRIVTYFKTSNNFLNISLLIGSFLGIITGLLMQYYTSVFVILLFIFILLLENVRKPAGIAIVTDMSESKVHSGILSVASQLGSLFTALFILIIGYFSDIYGVGVGIGAVSILLATISLFVRIK
ncbi:MAG: MFS transporter [Melioribacteraceae bacterium]